MNNDDFVSYEIAQALKKAGFDYPCYFYYTKQDAPDECVWHTTSEEAPIDYNRSGYAECSMPTLAQAQKWLREVHGISVEPVCNMVRKWNVNVCEMDEFGEAARSKIGLDTYESALSAGIEVALKLVGY